MLAFDIGYLVRTKPSKAGVAIFYQLLMIKLECNPIRFLIIFVHNEDTNL